MHLRIESYKIRNEYITLTKLLLPSTYDQSSPRNGFGVWPFFSAYWHNGACCCIRIRLHCIDQNGIGARNKSWKCRFNSYKFFTGNVICENSHFGYTLHTNHKQRINKELLIFGLLILFVGNSKENNTRLLVASAP